MNKITSFSELMDAFRSLLVKKRVAVACPTDVHTREAVTYCLDNGLASFTLIADDCDRQWCEQLAEKYAGDVVIISAVDKEGACRSAVAEAKGGRADVLMKGLVNTDTILRAVLDKQHGLLPHGRVLTHITAIMVPGYGRLMLFSDAAVIPTPSLEQLDAMVGYGVELCRNLKITTPNVALIHFSEKTSEKHPHTISYSTIKQWAANGKYGTVNVDGPMDVKTACDAHSAEVKGLVSAVSGKADLLIFPNLVAANTFYKTLALFAHASTAAVVCGAEVPVVVPSRADLTESKLYSLALACVAEKSSDK